MLLTALCQRRLSSLQIASAADKAGFHWHGCYQNLNAFQEYVRSEQPAFALVTESYLDNNHLFAALKAASPKTLVLLCLPADTRLSKMLAVTLDALNFDVLCTTDELTGCLPALKAGRFYESALLRVPVPLTTAATLPGWNELTTNERRVLALMLTGSTGPQIANALHLSAKTINNHKAKISQKLNVTGGPGSLTRFVFTHRDEIQQLLN